MSIKDDAFEAWKREVMETDYYRENPVLFPGSAFDAGWDAAVKVGIEAARSSGRLMPSAWLALEAQGATEEDLFGPERLDAQS